MDERDPRAWNDENPAQSGRGADEEREVRELLELAGPRPELPAGDLDAIVAAGRVAWRDAVGEPAVVRRPGMTRITALAAAVVVALGIGWWWSATRSGELDGEGGGGGAGEPVAQCVAAWDAREPLEGRTFVAGTAIETGDGTGPLPSRLALRLSSGIEVRLDADTRLRLASATEVELERGAVYVDTGAASGTGLAVRTPFGVARDVGTRFQVRLGDHEAPLRVRVRDGSVVVERGSETRLAAAGEAIVVRGDGVMERRRASGYGPAWNWVTATAPRFELEGRTLAQLLEWVSRETGWVVRYEDPGLAAAADDVVLHGSLGDLRPDQAPFAVLPGAGLEGEFDEGTLVVRRR